MNRILSLHTASAACLSVLLAACAATAPRSDTPAMGAPQSDAIASASRPRSARDVLTAEEISAAAAGTAHDLIQRLRPAWLRQKGDPSVIDGSYEIRVWVNGRDAGGLGVLRDQDSRQVVSARWVDPINARSTYGRLYGRGVIALQTR